MIECRMLLMVQDGQRKLVMAKPGSEPFAEVITKEVGSPLNSRDQDMLRRWGQTREELVIISAAELRELKKDL